MNGGAQLTFKFWCALILFIALLLGSALLVFSSPAMEQRITIYSPTANYSLNVIQHAGKDYVGLLEILEPLGRVASRQEGRKWKLRFKGIDSQFAVENNRARVGRRDIDLGAPFLIQNNRGLVPLDSLTTLLPLFLEHPVTFHAGARRVFINLNGTTYSTVLSNTAPPKLVLTFSNPVNPTIHTEAGKLTMLFVRDPVISSGSATATFPDRDISSATFQENNGAAEITITGTVSLMASFSNNGRTITIAPPPSAAPVQAVSPVPGTTQSTVSPVPTNTSPATPMRRFVVAIDPSHGGDERGAAFADNLLEKDITLALGRRIRATLESQGVSTILLRDSDNTLSTDQRASAANSAHASLYVGLHAASDGTGVRIYTALLPGAADSRGPFLSWDAAQANSLALSHTVATALTSALGKTVAARLLSAPLQPMNSVTAPAVSIEVAPRTPGNVADLSAADYQQVVANSVASAIVSTRSSLGGGL